MLYKAIALSTLAAIVASELSQQVLANPNPTTAQPPSTARNYVVPVQGAPENQPSVLVAAPEVSQTREFTSATSGKSPTSLRSRGVDGRNNDIAVLATDVKVVGASEELQQVVLRTIATRPGGQTNQSQINKDVEAILNTGLFADAKVSQSSHRDGWNVVYQVQPVVLRSLQLSGNKVLTPEIANNIFKSQLGKPVSLAGLRDGVKQVSQWYKDNGYILAQVLDVQSTSDGAISLKVVEGVVGDIKLNFLDEKGESTKGRTREDYIKREIKMQPGEVFKVDAARADLQQLYQLGLFDKVDVALNGDGSDVDVIYNITERQSRGVNAGAGYDNDNGIFGTISYNDQNLGGVNQKLGVNVQFSRRDLQFDGNYGKPYQASNPDSPGYNVNVFRRRSVSQTFDGDVDLANGDNPR
ncbi:MAG TPA: hypothetical protein DD000_07500, partial [Cyanobacteria bacterium UBA11166]|nr:hypothetical protein [Cyanobacteria bacterium UBA11166]